MRRREIISAIYDPDRSGCVNINDITQQLITIIVFIDEYIERMEECDS